MPFLIQTELLGPQMLPLLVLYLPAVLATSGVLAIGALFLLGTPKANEREKIKKFLMCYVIVFAIFAISKFVDLGNLARPIRNIASAYGTFYLIAFFQVLAENRGSFKLRRIVAILNRSFVILIVGTIACVILTAVLKLPGWISITFVLFVGLGFYINWMRTLWTAMAVTQHDHQNEFAWAW